MVLTFATALTRDEQRVTTVMQDLCVHPLPKAAAGANTPTTPPNKQNIGCGLRSLSRGNVSACHTSTILKWPALKCDPSGCVHPTWIPNACRAPWLGACREGLSSIPACSLAFRLASWFACLLTYLFARLSSLACFTYLVTCVVLHCSSLPLTRQTTKTHTPAK